MPAARRPLRTDSGGTFDEVFSWQDDQGSPVPIAATYSVQMRVFDGLTSEPLIDLTSEAGDAIQIEPGGATGDIRVQFQSNFHRTAMYLLQLHPLGGGNPVDLVYGPIRLSWRGAA
jgi:hypothetical protein